MLLPITVITENSPNTSDFKKSVIITLNHVNFASPNFAHMDLGPPPPFFTSSQSPVRLDELQ